ncbi:transposase [Escherichia coli]|nr:transposase [Escherichia coli]
MPCFTAMRAEIALMSGSAFAVTHHAFSSGAGRTSDGNGSHASTLKSPSYTKSVSWQHYRNNQLSKLLKMGMQETKWFTRDLHTVLEPVASFKSSFSKHFRLTR